MTYETLTVSQSGGVTHLTLNRPEKRNALSALMIEELTDFALGCRARAVILSGAGDVFCAGGDLTWMRAQIEADRATRMSEARKLAHMLRALNEMPSPLIGVLHGGAYGGGVGLAAICDVALAATGTRFGLTETRLGLIPATISPYVLARMGEGAARRVFMSSRIFGVEEAQSLGLIASIHPAEELKEAALAEAMPYLRVAPGAVGRAKALARRLGPPITEEVIEETVTRLADAWETEEAAQGIAAFLAKRSPPWVEENSS